MLAAAPAEPMPDVSDLPALDVAIGLILVFLVLALVVSGLNELIARALGWRAAFLEEGIRNLLDDPDGSGLAGEIYAHPLVRGLQRKGAAADPGKARRPSYIPSDVFALALFDTLAPPADGSGNDLLEGARQKVEAIENEQVKRALLALLRDARGERDAFRKNVEKWFDSAMERVSGWYKRRAATISLILSMIVVFSLNADSFQIANTLWTDGTIRAAVVAEASTVASGDDPTAEPDLRAAAERVQKLEALKLPIGWSGDEGDPRKPPGLEWALLWKILGIAVTGLAVSLGAPFWFDALGKATRLRAAGQRPKKAED